MWKCSVCGEESEPQYDTCWKCDTKRADQETADQGAPAIAPSSGRSGQTPTRTKANESASADRKSGAALSPRLSVPESWSARLVLGIIGAVVLALAGVYLATVEAYLSDSILEIIAHGVGYISFGLAALTLAYALADRPRTGAAYQLCPSCREPVAADAKRCPKCLLPLGVPVKDCPECLEPINYFATRCPWCASDLIEEA